MKKKNATQLDKSPEPDMSLSERLKKSRKDSAQTLEQVSAAAGMSKTYLWELEHDEEGTKRPSVDVLLKIAEALKTTIVDLLGLPSVQVNQSRVDVSKSLIEFRDWMKAIGQPLADGTTPWGHSTLPYATEPLIATWLRPDGTMSTKFCGDQTAP